MNNQTNISPNNIDLIQPPAIQESINPPIHQSTTTTVGAPLPLTGHVVPKSDEGGSLTHPLTTFPGPFPAFTQAVADRRIDPRRLAKLFAPFTSDLRTAGITLPDHETANGSYFDAVTSAVALPDRLPAPLCAALLTLETAASPQNQNLIDESIARRIPCVAVNQECAIDRALELWFLVPDELDQFQPPAAAESVQCPVFSIQSTHAAPPSPASLSTINSPTINPEFLPLTDSLTHPLTTPQLFEVQMASPARTSELEVQSSSPAPSTLNSPTLNSEVLPLTASPARTSLAHPLITPAAGVRGNGFEVQMASPARTSELEVQCSSSPDPEGLPLPGGQSVSDPDFKVQSSKFNVQSSDADTESFSRLARLSPAEYDRARRAEAKRLDLRIETLDTEVAKCRFTLDAPRSTLHAPLAALHSPDPWPEPVCGAEALDQVASRYSLYLVLPPGAADAMALWTTHTHALAAFHLSPRLSLYSPKPGCGKTTAFDVLTTMLPRPLRTENISPAVLFRLVDQYQPALLLDEVDAYLPQSEELRGLLNAGHKRGACAYRCEGEGKAVRAFRAFAPAALAGIGSLPATLRDRSVLIPLVPAEEGQIAARFDPLRTDIEKTLARKLARWAADNFDALAACDPPLPPGAFNRLADNWRPLLAVAQIAGGDWPARALAAFQQLAAPNPTFLAAPKLSDARRIPHLPDLTAEKTFNLQLSTSNQQLSLLENIRKIFEQTGATRISSRDLAAALVALTNQNSTEPTHSLTDSLTHSLSAASLARLLAPFGISPRAMRIGATRAKGYDLADFMDAFTCFLNNEQSGQPRSGANERQVL